MTALKAIKRTLKIALCILLVLVIGLLGYAGYLLLSYSRIEDKLPIEVSKTGEDSPLKQGEEYTVYCHNIGFGAYTKDFTFFMDGGTESWAESRESVLQCVGRSSASARGFDPDIILFQEVDTGSTRSYQTDQRKLLTEDFADYSSAFAVNYHSAFLMYPFNQPHGASNSGILTLSKSNITSSLRRSLPISTGFSKFLDLDRCYSISRIPVENGKELVVFNVHLSAYGGTDEIRSAQMNMLFSDMEAEYKKGNYCLCGGDFNHDFTGDSTKRLNGGESVDFGWAQPFPEEFIPEGFKRCTDYAGESLIPSCRNCDVPYEKGNFTIIVDGYIVSDNIETVKVENLDLGFEFSDHNPVVMNFTLK